MSLSRYDLPAGSAIRMHGEASLLYISTAKYGPDWHSILHAHGFTELFYVLGGKGQFQVRDSCFSVAEGDLVLVEPNTEHTETSVEETPLEYIVLGIDGILLPPDPSCELPYRLLRLRGGSPEILNQLRMILRETGQQAPGYELVCQSLLNVLLVQIARQIGFAADGTVPRTGSRDSTAARRYIDLHYRENLTLDTIAQAVHISKYHLAHIFSREYGVSPIHYMQQLRLQECRELLRTTDFSVAQIARMTGFSSPSYFSQRFGKAEGMTPAQYRHQYNKREHQDLEDISHE